MSQKMLKPNFVKVREVQTANNGFSLYAKVIKVEEKKFMRDGNKIDAVEAIVGDETGIVKTFFKGKTIDLIQQNNVIAIRNGFKRLVNKFYVVSIDDFGRVTQEKDKVIEINNLYDVSGIQREEIRKQKPRKERNTRSDYKTKRPFNNNYQREYDNYYKKNTYKQAKQKQSREKRPYNRYERDNYQRNYNHSQRFNDRNYDQRNNVKNETKTGSYAYNNPYSYSKYPQYNANSSLYPYPSHTKQSQSYLYNRAPSFNQYPSYDTKSNYYPPYKSNANYYPSQQTYQKHPAIIREDSYNFGYPRYQQKIEEKNNWIKISSIEPGQENLDIIVRILEVRLTEFGKRVRCRIGDETGISQALLEARSFVQKGATLNLKDVEARVVNEHIQLYVHGRMQISRAQIVKINEDYNISKKEWVPVPSSKIF